MADRSESSGSGLPRDAAALRAQWHARQLRRGALERGSAEGRLRRLRVLLGLLFTAVVCLHLQGGLALPFLDAADRALLDARLGQQRPAEDDRVVFVDVDAQSLAAVSPWPWPRVTLARLVEELVDRQGAEVVGVALPLAEGIDPTGRRLLERVRNDPRLAPLQDLLAGLVSAPDEDARLAAALRDRPVVLGWQRIQGPPAPGIDWPRPFARAGELTDDTGRLPVFGAAAGQPEALLRAAMGSGFADLPHDEDGVTRRLSLLALRGTELHRSFALALLERVTGATRVEPHDDGLWLRGGARDLLLPAGPAWQALLPGLGETEGVRRVRRVPAAALLDGRLPAGSLQGKVVVLGATAPAVAQDGLGPDRRMRSPAELQAAFVSAALAGDLKREPGQADLLTTGVTAATGVLLSLLLPRLAAVGVLLAGLVAMLTLLAWNGAAFSNLGWVLPLAASLGLVTALTVFNLVAGYFAEGRSRRAMLRLFGEYVGPQLVERMALDPAHFRMDGEDKELTVMFCDIRGFTRIGETMAPQQLREYLNTALTMMTDVIHRYNGTVDKYIGDAVMAFWGAPVDDPLHADHAVAAALAMQDEVGRLNEQFAARGWPALAVGVGLNTGLVRVGDMGSRARRAYTVIGDTVNLAARFEQLTKSAGVSVLVGENTALDARSHRFREIGLRHVTGRREPVRVFEPLEPAVGERPAGSRLVLLPADAATVVPARGEAA